MREKKSKILIIELFVEDLIFRGKNHDDIQELKKSIMQEFETFDLVRI